MTEPVGIYYFVATGNTYFLCFIPMILLIFTDDPIHFLRDMLEGLGYQTSLASKYGDKALCFGIVAAMAAIHDNPALVPDSFQSIPVQCVIGIVCPLTGINLATRTMEKRSGKPGDIYHDLVVVPMLLFAGISMFMPIVANSQSSYYVLSFAVFAIIFWAVLLRLDFKSERIYQRTYLKDKKGIRL